MSIIQRIHDRLTGVLGRDCQGKPLRAGDPVEIIDDGNVLPEYIGVRAVVIRTAGPCDSYPGQPRVEITGNMAGLASSLMRLDDNDDANWASITEATGWTPRTVEQPSEVPV